MTQQKGKEEMIVEREGSQEELYYEVSYQTE